MRLRIRHSRAMSGVDVRMGFCPNAPRLFVISMLVAWACLGPVQAQEGLRRYAPTQLHFASAVPSLEASRAVAGWVAGGLQRRPGLNPSDRFETADEPSVLGEFTVYRGRQTAAGVPAVDQEPRPLLDGVREPQHLPGERRPLSPPLTSSPSLDQDQAIVVISGTAAGAGRGQLVFWPGGDERVLSYVLKGQLESGGRDGPERAYLNARNGEVLQGFPLTVRAEAARDALAHAAGALCGKASRERVATHVVMDAVRIPGEWAWAALGQGGAGGAVYQEDPANESTGQPRSEGWREAGPRRFPEPDPYPPPGADPGLEAEVPPGIGTEPGRDRRQRADPEAGRGKSPAFPRTLGVPTPEPAPPVPQGSLRGIPRILLLLLALLLLAVLGYVVAKYRPRSGVGEPAPGPHPDGSRAGAPDPGGSGGLHPPQPVPLPPWAAGALVPLDGSHPIPLSRALLVSAEGLVVGRAGALCHVEVQDRQVSRRHLRLRLIEGAIAVEDLGSTAGTSIDGNILEPFHAIPLRSGRRLGLAESFYRLETA